MIYRIFNDIKQLNVIVEDFCILDYCCKRVKMLSKLCRFLDEMHGNHYYVYNL